MNEYERKRQENIEANQKILREMGLERPLSFSLQKPPPTPKKQPPTQKTNKRKRYAGVEKNRIVRSLRTRTITIENLGSAGGLRRSNRLANKPTKSFTDECSDEDSNDEYSSNEEDSDEYEARPRKIYRPKPPLNPNWRETRPDPKQFGEIPNVPVGTWWFTRMECCHAGVHGPPVAGIAYYSEGATSVALSGGYEDDVDWGEAFTYTGSGGRDLRGTADNPKNLRTAPQSKDQTLTCGNLALKISFETKKPIRVIRGYKLNNQYAPSEGVERWWEEVGVSGFKVYKYAFKRLPVLDERTDAITCRALYFNSYCFNDKYIVYYTKI
ncbi:9374_t:CDS:2 [Entrophospora sp. SA101]|nr:9374_t:CDS:2 [Entrophospora sp. SA101]